MKANKGKQKKPLNPQQLLEKQKKLTGEVFILKNEIVNERHKKNLNKWTIDECKQQLSGMKDELSKQNENYKSVNANLIREFKTLKTSSDEKVSILQQELRNAKVEIENKDNIIKEMEETHKKTTEYLNSEIDSLKDKINGMEKEFENIFNNTIDNLLVKIKQTREKCHNKIARITKADKQFLIDLGLVPKYKL